MKAPWETQYTIEMTPPSQFIALLGGVATWPLTARAQLGERVWTIGILASQPLPPIQRFTRKLQDYGYIEGQTLRLVSRFAERR